MTGKEIEKIIKKVQADSDKKMEKYLGSIKEHTDDRFKAIQEGTSSTHERLDVIQSDIEVVKNNLNSKVDRYEFEALNRRVSTLEKKTN